MPPITPTSQFDPNQSYTSADYLTWKFDEFVELIKGKLLRPSKINSCKTPRQCGPGL